MMYWIKIDDETETAVGFGVEVSHWTPILTPAEDKAVAMFRQLLGPRTDPFTVWIGIKSQRDQYREGKYPSWAHIPPDWMVSAGLVDDDE